MVKKKKFIRRDPEGREISTEEEDGVLRDGETMHVSVFLADGFTPNPKLTPVQVAVGKHAQLSDAEIAREQAYADADYADSNRWRSPDNPPPAPINNKMSAEDALAQAYADYDLADAVRYKTNDYLARGKYPGGSFQCEGQPQVGASCRTQHGVPGFIQTDEQGRFVCIAVRHDAQTVDSMSAADAREAAYLEYDRIAQNSWRGAK